MGRAGREYEDMFIWDNSFRSSQSLNCDNLTFCYFLRTAQKCSEEQNAQYNHFSKLFSTEEGKENHFIELKHFLCP